MPPISNKKRIFKKKNLPKPVFYRRPLYLKPSPIIDKIVKRTSISLRSTSVFPCQATVMYRFPMISEDQCSTAKILCRFFAFASKSFLEVQQKQKPAKSAKTAKISAKAKKQISKKLLFGKSKQKMGPAKAKRTKF